MSKCGTTMTPPDTDIWRLLGDLREATAWPPDLVIDTISEDYGIPREACARVWRQLAITWQGE